MLKTILIAAAIATALAGTSSLAAGMKCDDAAMAALRIKVISVKDANIKKMALGHIAMAQDSMKAGKMDDCRKQMGDADRAIGKM